MPWKWYDGKVVDIRVLSPSVRQFTVDTCEPPPFVFRPGQFVTMDLPVSEKRLQRWRSYSIASAPTAGSLLEFCIVHLEGGLATDYLFNQITVGSQIRFKGPDGNFVLPDRLDHDLVMICTGTGVAPFRSMLRYIRETGMQHRGLHLIFGARRQEDILYREEFEALTHELPGFRYDVALSREAGWEGYQGYVHKVYLEQHTPARQDVRFFLCGWTQMIDDAVANLIVKMGYNRSQVVYELYG